MTLGRGNSVCRRQVLRLGVAGGLAAATGVIGLPKESRAALSRTQERHLSFHNIHTGERREVVYAIGSRYLPHGLAQLDQMLRDWRTDEACEMAPELMDTLWLLRQRLGSNQPFHLISGYRSPATNASLAAASDGVASNSYHMRGMAVDISLPDVRLRRLRTAALDLGAGGVGFYPRSGFVHVDVGPQRHW